MTNDDSKTIEKDEILDRLVEEKRYKDAYQRCIEMIARKEHVSYAKLTMRSLIDKIEVKEYRKEIGGIVLCGFVVFLLIFAQIVCVSAFHLDGIVTGIVTLVLIFIAIAVTISRVRVFGSRYNYEKAIRMDYTPHVTIEKIRKVMEESLPGYVLQILKNAVDIKSKGNDGVKARVRLIQNERRKCTTIAIQIYNKSLAVIKPDEIELMRNVINSLKDGIPNMIDDSNDQYIPKEMLESRERIEESRIEKNKKRIRLGCGIGCGTIVLAMIIPILAAVIGQSRKAPHYWPNPDAQPLSNDLTFNVNGVQFVMKPVEGGTFRMGATSEQWNRWERPDYSCCEHYEDVVHKVTLNSFYIAETEVTQALWEAVMGTTISQQRDKDDPSLSLFGEGDDCPMYYVSWNEWQEFLGKLNQMTGKDFRFPTEAEWEYAARGGANSEGYRYAGSNNFDDVAWYSGNSERKVHAVKGKPANELGLYDMSGNVSEWCGDWIGDYGKRSQVNPNGPMNGSKRVVRGGCYDEGYGGSENSNSFFTRLSERSFCAPDVRNPHIGLRLALSE